MKIGIVTLPFNWNYGGILQTWALQQALKEMGHDATTINRNTILMPFKMKVLSFVRRTLLTLMGKKVVVRTWPTKTEEKIIRQHTDRFIKEHVATTKLFRSEADFSTIDQYGFEAFVCGSDQVWRPKYSPSLANHFLGFLPKESKALRLSYAASFGVDNWEYSPKDTQICSNLALEYDSISVREDSAIDLCEKHLGVRAKLVLDPTLLIPSKKYVELVEKDDIQKMPGQLFNYVLDLNPKKEEFIEKAAQQLGLKAFSSTAGGSFRDLGKKRLNDCIFPPVTQWIRSFMDAEFVITDSFHGTAFSIIFNKPFLSIGNKKRGITRFSSLLKMIGLEDRLIFDFGEAELAKLADPIDFEKVNKALEKQRLDSIDFLQKALAIKK